MAATDKNIFINGKKQIIEMLQFMPDSEKQKLLDNIRYKNPKMARELTEKSLSFEGIFLLENSIIQKVIANTDPTIIGLALNLTNSKLQRKVLQMMKRNEAEKAFHIMGQNLRTKKAECLRAQNRMISIAISFNRQLKSLL